MASIADLDMRVETFKQSIEAKRTRETNKQDADAALVSAQEAATQAANDLKDANTAAQAALDALVKEGTDLLKS